MHTFYQDYIMLKKILYKNTCSSSALQTNGEDIDAAIASLEDGQIKLFNKDDEEKIQARVTSPKCRAQHSHNNSKCNKSDRYMNPIHNPKPKSAVNRTHRPKGYKV